MNNLRAIYYENSVAVDFAITGSVLKEKEASFFNFAPKPRHLNISLTSRISVILRYFLRVLATSAQ